MTAPKDHVFRVKRPPAGAIKEIRRQFVESETQAFRRWTEYHHHQHVIEDALAVRLLGNQALDPAAKAALAALRKSLDSRLQTIRDETVTFTEQAPFRVTPGLNFIVPPYDYSVEISQGSAKALASASQTSGEFHIAATALPQGRTISGAAGVGLFLVPSSPARTLAIRPFLSWHYAVACESHGTPTAHASGTLWAKVTGFRSGGSTPFPGKSLGLFSISSDLWDDAHESDSGEFGPLDSELVVSGCDSYSVLYYAATHGDAHQSGVGWSAAFVQIHCRVPLLVVQEF